MKTANSARKAKLAKAAALARLAKKPGRRPGQTTTFTVEGDPWDENRRRAIFGKLENSLGASFIHQLWCEFNPSKLAVENWNRCGNPEEQKAAGVKVWAHLLGEEAAARFAKGDFQFFADMAVMARRLICKSPWQDDLRRTILLAHVQCESEKATREGRAAPSYSIPDLMTVVDWMGNLPSETQLRRLCSDLAVPLRTGRPPKVKR